MALPYATENQLKEISKRIKSIIENKQDKLIEGENISIKDNIISARSPIKVYEWELEINEDTDDIYVKNPEAFDSFEKIISENALINLYINTEDMKIYLGHFFMSYGLGGRDQTAIDLGYLAGNTAAGGSPNDIYHIYLIGDEEKQKLKYNLVKVETGGSSYTPLELTMTLVNDTPTVELTKEQYDTLIDAINNKEPIIAWATYTNNSTLRLPIALPTKMNIGEQSIYAGVASYVSALLIDMSYNWVLLKNEEDNQTTYSLFLTQLTNFSKDWGLYSETELGSGFCFGNGGNLETQGSKIYVSKFNDTPIIDYGRVPLNAYTDTINNKNILQFSTLSPEINNYYAPTTINETSTPKILQSKNSQMEWIDLPSSGGSESVSPTLNLIDLEEGTPRTTITEQEKLNLDKGLYNQIYYFRSNKGSDILSMYMPSRLFSLFEGGYLFSIMIVTDETNPVVNNLEFYFLEIGEKNANGEYPITIQSGKDSGLPNIPFGTGGSSSEIPTLSTIAPSMSDLTTTVYSDDDIALIKKQKDNFIKVPFGTADNNTSELCYVFSLNNAYSLIDVAGNILSFVNAFAEAPNFIYFNLDETNKKLVGESYSALSATDTSLYVLSSDNQIYLTNQLKSGVGQALNKSYYFDKINGKSIIHEDSTINNYTIPTITFED